MALFEQQFSEESVTLARTKIAGGASLRFAAAEIGCAPSTLSVRIKKAKAAEAYARARAGRSDADQSAQGTHPHTPTVERRGATPDDAGPVEVLRGALGATKASGQPDWPTRVSAARALAVLRPDEVNPETERTNEPSIVVYDLPPGSDPVLHRARNRENEPPVPDIARPPENIQTSEAHFFNFRPQGRNEELIGTWNPDLRGQPDATVTLVFHKTEDPETAELWRRELAAGRLPVTSDEGSE